MNILKSIVNSTLDRFGLQLIRAKRNSNLPVEFDQADREIMNYVLDNKLSMASAERLFATLMACRHVCDANIEGDFVECGVWRGGNSIIAADVFKRLSPHRGIYLFDTFAGMTEPTLYDVKNLDGKLATKKYKKAQKLNYNEWCYASLDDVRSSFNSYQLLNNNVHFIEGDVLKTIIDSNNIPEKISVLRLDTDWYESTRIELDVLWPRLQIGGILIIDDYGHWDGARKAVDEFFKTHTQRPFLAAIPNLSWAVPQATVLHSKGQIQGALRTENRFSDPCLRPVRGPSSFDAAKFGIAAFLVYTDYTGRIAVKIHD